MKSYFTDAAPFASFTSANTLASPTKKRKSNGVTYPSRKTTRKNITWSPDSKKIAVQEWLLKLNKSSIAPTSRSASSYILPTVNLLKEKYPHSFNNLKKAHLVTWTKKYIADGNSVEILNSDKREVVSIGHNRIIPVLLQYKLMNLYWFC